jgi:NADH-quinone oxidoreductase subunit H
VDNLIIQSLKNLFFKHLNFFYTFHLDTIMMVLIVLKIFLIAAFLVLWERRLIAAVQRRRGPNVVGAGFLQPISDALKLLLKESLIPSQSNRFLFISAPCFILLISLVI